MSWVVIGADIILLQLPRELNSTSASLQAFCSEWSGTPIVTLGTSPSKAMLAFSRSLGARCVLTCPLSQKQLLQVVRELTA